jgi:hypothetical protein
MIPKNINKEHIISAIKEIDKNGIRKGRHSSTYDVLFNKKLYPPKLLISLANKYVNGIELDHNSFSGGPGKEAFKLLELNGFKIKTKMENLNSNQAVIDAIEINKVIINNKLNELPMDRLSSPYNELIKPLNENFKKKYKTSTNLFIQNILKESIDFYDDTPSLKIQSFGNWGRKINPYVWTAFYVDSNQDQPVSHSGQLYILINHQGIKFGFGYGDRVNNNYPIVSDVIKKPELQSKILEGIDYKLFEALKLEPGSASIPFDAHSKINIDLNNKEDFKENWNADINLIKSYTVDKIPNNIREEIISQIKNLYYLIKPQEITKPSDNRRYWLYSPGEQAYKWDEFNKDNILGLGWDELGDLTKYKSRNEIRDALKSVYGGLGDKKNDVSANDDFVNKVNIGDIVIVKKGKKELLGYGEISSDYYFDDKRNDYKSCRKIDWKLKGNWKIKGNMVVKTFTDITSYQSIDSDYDTYYERLLGIMKSNNDTKKISKMNLTLNTILYGPPGTGKTYRLKNEFFNKFIDKSSIKTEEEFLQELVSEFSWWEVIAASLHIMQKAKVAQISEHPLIKAKLANSSNNSIRATIWGTLQAHTVQECEYVNVESRQVPLIFSKNEDSIWEVLAKNLESEAPEVIELVSKSKEFKPQTFSKKRYVFTTFHQSFSYEDFIEGIKPVIYENEQNSTLGKQVIYEIKPGLFKQIVKDANADRDNDYAIFIDEINRGNIANIFGELITLIEDDKRIDTDNYIPAKLPYSNEDFGVPPNLYIIGTMNTADRSVEALDTALRRRFSFIEMNPEPAKLSTTEFKCDGIDLESLLISINSRIEKLLDKDYCIGHSYFMTIKNRKQPLNEIKAIFKNKILPLLQEYFYGDWGKIMLVIGKEFVEKKKGDIKFLSTDSYDEFEEYDEKPIYNFTNSSKWTLDSFLSIYE